MRTKKLVSKLIVLILSLSLCFSVNVFAAENNSLQVYSTLHKVNGTGSNGGYSGFYATTTRTTSVIKILGECDSTSKDAWVSISAYSSITGSYSQTVVSGKFTMNNSPQSFFTGTCTPGTYYIEIYPYFSGGYSASAYFYY